MGTSIKTKIWDIKDLPPLLVGDCLAFRAEGIQKPIISICKAKSWHWAMVGAEIKWEEVLKNNGNLGDPLMLSMSQRRDMFFDYQVVDSTSKGITHHLLSEYQHRHMRVYRSICPLGKQLALKEYILYLYLYYGMRPYDYLGVAAIGLWWILNHVGIKVDWWGHSDKSFWCLELPDRVHGLCGLPLIPVYEPAYPYNMEHSENLSLIWGTY